MNIEIVQCSQVTQCRNNACLIRQVEVLGLKADNVSDWQTQKKYGKSIVPLLQANQNGLSVSLECESYVSG